jgi:hypothetical protein
MTTNNKLENVCKFIQRNDRNSDIMDCYSEYLNNEIPKETLLEICERILNEWLEDSLTINDQFVTSEDIQDRKTFNMYIDLLNECK